MEADGFFSPGSTFAPRMVLLTMYEIVTNTAAISKNQERTALVCKGNGPRPAKTITREKSVSSALF
jgi:acyl-CoA synthetase (AMP-forming)/AMP-acid ligase II